MRSYIEKDIMLPIFPGALEHGRVKLNAIFSSKIQIMIRCECEMKHNIVLKVMKRIHHKISIDLDLFVQLANYSERGKKLTGSRI